MELTQDLVDTITISMEIVCTGMMMMAEILIMNLIRLIVVLILQLLDLHLMDIQFMGHMEK